MGFFRLSKSPSASPFVFANKKDESLRFCGNCRALIRFTVKNSYPLTQIDWLIDQSGNAKYFRTVYFRSGYHQMRIAEKNIPMTAFSTIYEHYEHRVVLYGCTNTPAAFTNTMDDVFNDYRVMFVMLYLDDRFIYSDTWENQRKHVKLFHIDYMNKSHTLNYPSPNLA